LSSDLTYPKISALSTERVGKPSFDLTRVQGEGSILFVLPLLGTRDHRYTTNNGCAVPDSVTLLNKPCCLNKLGACLRTTGLSDVSVCFLTVSYLITGFKLDFDSRILGNEVLVMSIYESRILHNGEQ